MTTDKRDETCFNPTASMELKMLRKLPMAVAELRISKWIDNATESATTIADLRAENERLERDLSALVCRILGNRIDISANDLLDQLKTDAALGANLRHMMRAWCCIEIRNHNDTLGPEMWQIADSDEIIGRADTLDAALAAATQGENQ